MAKVCLAICAKDSIYTDSVRTILAIQHELMTNGHGFTIAINSQDSLLTRARDALANTFIKEPRLKSFTHILFMDSDIFASAPGAVLKLLKADKDIMASIYRIKSDSDYRPAVLPIDPKKTLADFQEPVECEYVSTGFLLVKREVLEFLENKIPFYGVGEQHLSHFFPSYIIDQKGYDGSISKNLISEDWGFCMLCREYGYKIWAMDTQLVHLGIRGYAFDKK
jgi:hypothetical protein